MFAPPTNGYRILIYGRDSTLLETRRLILASSGFRVDTVSTLHKFQRAVEQAQPRYELFILCHTVPAQEQEEIRALAVSVNTGLYQLQRMEPPPQFIGTVSEMVSNP
jgi:hypothetical protein